MVFKSLEMKIDELETRGRTVTIQPLSSLIRRFRETWRELLDSDFCKKSPAAGKNWLGVSHDKTWTWLRKGNFKRETEFLLMAAQISAIRTNHIKARIDKMQQNSKWRLCGDRDETIIHIISKCSKLAQKEYKARHDWVGKVIHWEMCKKFKFDHADKWCMHNPAPFLENDIHKLIWDFDIQTDHLISARRPDIIRINKKKKKKETKSAKLSILLFRLIIE